MIFSSNPLRRRRTGSTPSTSFFLLSLLSLLLLLAPAAPAPPAPLTTLDLALLEAPAPPPSPAAAGKRYLFSTLAVGPSHAFVIARVARELVARGGSVTLLCPSSMRKFFDVPPPGVRTLSLEIGRGGGGDGGEGKEGENGGGRGGREPTEADFADEGVKWRTVHYDTSGELMRVRYREKEREREGYKRDSWKKVSKKTRSRFLLFVRPSSSSKKKKKRLPALMKKSRGNILPWQNFHLFADGLAAECDELVANERLLKAARLARPDVFVGDLMESCFPVLGERAFRRGAEGGDSSNSSSPSAFPPPPPPRVAIHNGPVITPMFDAAGFDLVGRDWGVPAQLGSSPTFGAGLSPPLSLPARALNLAHFLGNSAHDFLRMRPIVQALHRRHGVPFRGDGRSSELEVRAAKQRDALLVFQGDWAIDWPRPMPPATLVAGPVMHGPAGPLPADLQAWVEGARTAGEKVVYVALGSTFVLDPEKSKEIVRTLDEVAPSARLLVKFSEKDLPEEAERELREELNNMNDNAANATTAAAAAAGTGQNNLNLPRRGPERLRVVRWAPQNDLLGTPGAVALYVTHGGISSMSEAAFHGVPVVVIPQGAEQPDNAAKVEHRGLGVGLRRGASAAELSAAVKRVLEDEGGRFAAAARAAAVRMRAGRAPAASVVAAAIERVAVVSGAFEIPAPSSSSSSSPSPPLPLLPDPGWRMPSSDQTWVARHCLDAGALLLAVVVGIPALLLWGLRLAASRARALLSGRKPKSLAPSSSASSSAPSSRPRRASSRCAASGAAEHAKLS